MPIVSAPQLRVDFALDVAGLALVLLALPGLSALLVETPLLLLSERWGRRWLATASLGVMAACSLLAALSTESWLLAFAFVLWAPANGVGTALSEVALMDAAPDRRERMMTHWTLMGALGDLAAPALLAALAWLGWGWRAGMVVVAGMLALHGWVIGRRPWVQEGGGREADAGQTGAGFEEGSRSGARGWNPFCQLREGARLRGLGWWLLGTLSCSLLDELLVAFGALYLSERFQASLFEQTSAFAGFSLGQALGLLLTERLLSTQSARRVLGWSSLACAITFCAWLSTSSLPMSFLFLTLTGAFTAPLFPIATAQAYRTAPEHSTRVAALMQLTLPLELFLPLLVAYIADRAGLSAALLVLALQPVVMLVVLWNTRPTAEDRKI